ncbi:MAG: hypothetical protein PUP93_30775 [Rhizonema sp. NSF051]|nr:hypothetical protein [Rhizonema sp. NSF051]
MKEKFGLELDKYKHEESAKAANYILATSIDKCTKRTENETFIRDRFDFTIVGYGSRVSNLLQELFNSPFAKPSELAKSCLRLESNKEIFDDGEGGEVVEEYQSPVWIEARADGSTPMDGGFNLLTSLLETWVKTHSESFPPVVFNITDGIPDDMLKAQMSANKLKSVRTLDGSALLFNVHISSDNAHQVVLPSHQEELPLGDNYAKFLFDLSSPLPKRLIERARLSGLDVKAGAKAFVYNADPATLVEILEVGSQLDS